MIPNCLNGKYLTGLLHVGVFPEQEKSSVQLVWCRQNRNTRSPDRTEFFLESYLTKGNPMCRIQFHLNNSHTLGQP